MKNVRKIIAVLVVLCVLVTAQICTLAEDANAGISGEGAVVSQEADLVSKLKTAWSAMYKMTTVANLRTEEARNETEAVDLTKLGISFTDITNSEAGYVFNKTAHDSSVGYNNFLIFNSLHWDSYANAYKFFDSDVSDNSFNKAFTDNDDIVITFNTGEVKTAGKIRIVLRYKSWNTVYREIGISESNKEIKLSFKELFGLEKLSDALIRKDSDNDRLYTIRVAFSSELETNSAKIYPLKTLKYAELPENTDGFTAYDWLDAAQKFDCSGYFDTGDFVAARTALYDYLYENNRDFIVSELKDSWSKLSKDETVAAFDENSKIMNQNNAVSSFEEPSSMGITFNNDGTFDKAQHSNHFGGNYQLYGMTFNVNVNEENKPFTSGIDSFNNAFSNDSLYFTFNPGTVTKGAEIWVLLQYNGTGHANVLRSQIKITPADSGKEIKVDIKDLTYNCRDVSGYDNTKFALKNPVNNLNTDLCAIKIFFHHDLAFTGASISGLKYTNSETVPADTDGEIVTGKALRVDDEYYGEIANTFVKRREYLYNIIKGESELGDVNGVGGVDVCDLVRLCSVVSADGYDSENEYKLLGDMDVNGYVEATDISELRKTLFNMY